MLAAQIIEQGPAATVEEGPLIVAQAVQKIEHRIVLGGLLRRTRIVGCGQVHAVMDHLFEDVAIQSVAIDAALGRRRRAGD